MAGKLNLRKVASTPADSLLVKNFVKIALAHCVSKINAFSHFTQKFKMVTKWGQNNFGQNSPVVSVVTLWVKNYAKGRQRAKESTYTLRVKNFIYIPLARSISKINMFCVLCRNSRWPPKVVGNNFIENSPLVLHKIKFKLSISHSSNFQVPW